MSDQNPPPPPPGGYPPQQYPPQQPGGYPPQQPGGYPPQQPGGYPPPGPAYPQPAGGYPPPGPAYPQPGVAYGAGPCPNCGQAFGPERTCQNCGQVSGLPTGIRTSSPGRRLGAALLDFLLFIVTLVIGWIIWAIVVSGQGQSPAKRIMGLRVVKIATGRAATRGTMFGRWLVKRLMGLITLVYALAALWILWDKNRQALWDKVVETIVVDDKNGVLVRT